MRRHASDLYRFAFSVTPCLRGERKGEKAGKVLLLDQNVGELVRFYGEVVSSLKVLILERCACICNIAANLRDGGLLVRAQRPRQLAEVLFCRVEQLRCALLSLRRLSS